MVQSWRSMFLARARRARYVFLMRSGGGQVCPERGGRCKPRGRRVRPPWRGRVRCAWASTGRCFLIGGEGTSVHLSRAR